jgi:hypothetical protein
MAGAVTYNLFQHGRDPAILCAVPSDQPVPAFIIGSAWSFERAIQVGQNATEGFRPKLAVTAESVNGFYLFLAFRRAFHDPWIVAPSPAAPEPLAA